MNVQLLNQAKEAYKARDFATAVQLFAAAKENDTFVGEIDHLMGNCLMKMGMYQQAAAAYANALSDTSYGHVGALFTNQGRALIATGNTQAAVEAFQHAVQDTSYPTPFKAYSALGAAQFKLGNYAEAGAAYRQAAIDQHNPAPAAALASLGSCFVELGRPLDAVESFRTALDFAGPKDDVHALQASLGSAYVAAHRPADALDNFNAALADGTYVLSGQAQLDYEQAKEALGNAGLASGTAAMVDPLDPMGQTGNFMPDPSDTGFFTLSESEMIQNEKSDVKIRRRHRHMGLKIFLVVVVLLIVLCGGAGFAFTKGFGYPSQQTTLTELFTAVTNESNPDEFLAEELNDETRSLIISSIPSGATPVIDAMDAGMNETTAHVTVTLERGGTQSYEVSFVRNGMGWVVSSLRLDFASDGEGATVTEPDDSAQTDGATTDESSNEDATTEDTGDNSANEPTA